MSDFALLITAREEFLPRISWPAALPLIEDDELVGILENASNKELDGIVECLVDRGKWTCQLKRLQLFKDSYPNHRTYSRDIAAELQKYAGNTLANQLWRSGRGVCYEEMLKDVAKHLKVKPRLSNRETEVAIREHLLSELWKKMSEEERLALLSEYKIRDPTLVLKAVLPGALIKATTLSGFGAYKASVILANAFAKVALGHGLSFIANSMLTKSLSLFLGPVGWTLAGVYAAQVMGGEAYRVTVPCVLQISMIREANLLREKRPAESESNLALMIWWGIGALALSLVIFYLIARHWV